MSMLPMTGGPVVERLRAWQCQIADRLGFDFCMCCSRWHRESRMDHEIDGLCRSCGNFVYLDRIWRAVKAKAGVSNARI